MQCNDINTSVTSTTTFDSKDDIDQIDASIKSLGNEIRELKLDKEKNKDIIGIKVKELTSLKNKYTQLTTPASSSVSPSSSPTSLKSSNKKSNIDDDRSNQTPSQDSIITPRDQDYSMWYNDVIYASDMVDQSPVRGCMVIKPWGMGVWDILRGELDERIRDTGTSNAYFPLFIPQSFLSKEAEHVDGKSMFVI
jgi:prolyl-tRNA synthetase